MTTSGAAFFDTLLVSPIMVIIRNLDPSDTVERCIEAWDNRVQLVEVPVTNQGALESLREAVEAGRARGKHVGAGSISNPAQWESAVGTGADFTVAPGCTGEILSLAATHDTPHLPGVATATEVAIALDAGITWLKAFPAAQLGAGWFRAQLQPFPGAKFVATGGITPGNAITFLEAGACALGVGANARETIPLIIEHHRAQ